MATGRLPDPNSAPVTAKGDLYTYSTVPAKLAVGNNGETLVADSSTSTGLRWNPLPVLNNPVNNGGFDIWQRSTSAATTTGYTYQSADRWMFLQSTSAASTISRQNASLEGIQYCLRMQRNSGSTTTGAIVTNQSIESANCYAFAGKTVTFSFYAKAGANFSSSGNGLQYYLFSGTGTDQNVATAGFTGQVTAISGTATLTTSWQRFQFSATLGTSVTQLAPWFQYTPSGTAGANDFVDITGVQIDLGSVALPFRRSGGTLAGELAACQRYYYRTTASDSTTFTTVGNAYSTTQAVIETRLPVTMRVKPTAVDFSTLQIYSLTNGGQTAATNVTLNAGNGDIIEVIGTVASGLTNGHIVNLRGNGSGAYLGFSAEL